MFEKFCVSKIRDFRIIKYVILIFKNMKLQKILVRAVLFLLLVPFFIPVFNVGAVGSSLDFADVSSDHPNFDSVIYLKDQGVVAGYDDGTYKPDSLINRAEFLKIVMEASSYEPGGSNCFKDVKEEWYAPYICKAKELKLVDGYSDGTFKPGQDINFAEGSRMIVNILGISMSDKEKENWFQPYVLALGDINSIPATVEEFSSKMTRAEMADLIWRVDTKNYFRLSNTYDGLKEGEPASTDLKRFTSCDDIKAYSDNMIEISKYRYYLDMSAGLEENAVEGGAAPESASTMSKEFSAGKDSEKSVDYSGTNVQVEGVDESDKVKNDGKYIYLLKDEGVKILEAYPPEALKEVSSITFDDENFYSDDLYIDGNTLVVLGSSYSGWWGSFVKESDASIIRPYSYSKSKVYIYDVSDKSSVKLTRELSFDGSYDNSRKVGNVVYVVSSKYIDYWSYLESGLENDMLVPNFADSVSDKVSPVTSCSNVYYMPGSQSSSYLMVSAINLSKADSKVNTEVLIGDSGAVYSSKDNLYVVSSSWNPVYWRSDKGWQEQSIVHKFRLDKGHVFYTGSGEVPGNVLNQFSMDESDGYFRIATTEGWSWDTINSSTNNLYVLDSDLKIVGKLQGLAKGEQIYSVRFIGDRVYLVTFKSIDPLFVIDLSDATNPKVLGELKIPGVSDYLHPFDENHIIGFGMDTRELTSEEAAKMGGGFAWYQGIKMSLFDVTDVNSPEEMYKVVIGDRGTSSELIWNHKALLFDKEKGIMAFPISVTKIPDEVKTEPDTAPWSWYGDTVFQGAYVYHISLEKGFELEGTITHDPSIAQGEYGDYLKEVSRILYIGDYYYTVSDYEVMANRMFDFVKAGEVVLSGQSGY